MKTSPEDQLEELVEQLRYEAEFRGRTGFPDLSALLARAVDALSASSLSVEDREAAEKYAEYFENYGKDKTGLIAFLRKLASQPAQTEGRHVHELLDGLDFLGRQLHNASDSERACATAYQYIEKLTSEIRADLASPQPAPVQGDLARRLLERPALDAFVRAFMEEDGTEKSGMEAALAAAGAPASEQPEDCEREVGADEAALLALGMTTEELRCAASIVEKAAILESGKPGDERRRAAAAKLRVHADRHGEWQEKAEAAWATATTALDRIANNPIPERNPDGDDQAAYTMRLIARSALKRLERSAALCACGHEAKHHDPACREEDCDCTCFAETLTTGKKPDQPEQPARPVGIGFGEGAACQSPEQKRAREKRPIQGEGETG